MSFADKVVIVTGASRGIGKAIAQEFGKKCAKVACIASTEANALNTAQEILDNGGSAKAYGCDIQSAEQIKATVDKITEDLGAPTILVNNAGIVQDQLILRMSEEDWDKVIDVNLKGAFLFAKAVAKPMMKARFGRIINISSISGIIGLPGQTNYAASKAGLIGLTKGIAHDLGSRNITCNAICPGFIQTDMTSSSSDERKEYCVNKTLLKRLGSPEDIAHPTLFLASEGAGYITGQVLTVDGGYTLG